MDIIHLQYFRKHSGKKVGHIQKLVRTKNGFGTTHSSRRKNREKKGKCNQNDFLQVIAKYSWTTFKIIFETLSALDLSGNHYWKGGIQEIHDFQAFWRVFDIFA